MPAAGSKHPWPPWLTCSIPIALALLLDGFAGACWQHMLRVRLEEGKPESVVTRDVETGINNLSRLKDLGVMLSVDDFGTGYSSLSYLKRFPIDTLKIDQSFVRDTPSDKETVAIIQAIISMSHGLGLKTIAEGVESVQQADFLRRSRCDLLQGYRFSQSVTQAEFISLVKASRKGMTPWLARDFGHASLPLPQERH